MPLTKNDKISYGLYLIFFAALLALSFFIGCKKHVPPVVELATAPVTAIIADEKTVEVIPPTKQFEIPVTPEKNIQPVAGKDDQELTTVITVPASLVETKIQVYRKKKSIVKRLIAPNAPAAAVVSDNPQVIAVQPKKAVWWKWLIAILIALVSGYLAYRKFKSGISTFFSGGWSLITRWFK